MRNLAPGPKFSVLLAVALLITLAVWPIGYAKAEKISFPDGQKEKRNSEDDEMSVKAHRSVNFGDQSPGKSALYRKWETGADLGEDDDLYSSQSDPSGLDSYEGDGYGYDDDEYDHFNYKRYDADKVKLNPDDKMSNEEDKNALGGEKAGNVVLPEATTIEMLSFQAKNVNPLSNNMEQQKESSKVKPFSIKKTQYSDKDEEKEALMEEKIKKKTTTEEQKPDSNSSDKNTGNVKAAENKMSETKDSPENKVEKVKVSESGQNSQTNLRKENAQIAGERKESSASVGDGKNDAKIADLKVGDVKVHAEEKDGAKMKSEKDMDARVSEAKVDGDTSGDDPNESNPSRFAPAGSNFKDRFDNVNDPVIAEDEKDSEDNGMNLAGLRDTRNELPYQYPNGYRSNYLKKEAGRSVSGWESKPQFFEKDSLGKGPKEPFHLEFPVTDLENTDYRRNYMKTLKRYNNVDDSSRILSQGDTPSPYADEARKHLAAKVIEEEQRKRRSRLRRLKTNPVFFKKRGREEEEDDYDYDTAPHARMRYGMYRRNVFDRYNQPVKNYRRRGSYLLRDGYGSPDQFEEEGTKNVKNKRQDDAGFYADEGESYAEKRKSGKSNWSADDNRSQKKKLKESGSHEEPSEYNSNPLVLLQRNDNGEQAMKTFVDGRYKNEEGIDSENLARLLSRDSNYVILKKVPGHEELEAVSENHMSRSGVGDTRKEKYRISHMDLTMKANNAPSQQEPDIGKLVSSLKEGHAERPFKRKEHRIEDLSDFFKGDTHDDRDSDEKKEMLMSIDNRLSQYQRGEPSKKLKLQPSLSQAYRHMKDMDEFEHGSSDAAVSVVKLANKKSEKLGIGGQSPERLLKSFKKEGKEFLVLNKPFATTSVKGKSEDSMMQNPGMTNSAQNFIGNLAQMHSNEIMMTGGSLTPTSMYRSSVMPGNTYQEIKLPEITQKRPDANSKYFLFGSENNMANTPKHEVKVLETELNLPPDSSYNPQNYNQQMNSQNYNRASTIKTTQNGKTQPFQEARGGQYGMQQPYEYGKTQQCLANGYQTTGTSSATAEGFKRLAKKDESSGGLEKFMTDFQDFSQASYPNTFKSKDLPEMSLQELTSHGDRHLQKLNNLLKEIMSNKGEESGIDRAKNSKRGMFQKYKDMKNWQAGGDAQVRSGKWTSVVYDGSNRMGYSDKSTPGEILLKERKLEGKDAEALLTKDTTPYSKRTKRQLGYDSKDSTKVLEQKVKSTPYNVQPQPLFQNTNRMGNTNTNQQHKPPSRVCLQLPPDKLMDLLSFFKTEREDFGREDSMKDSLCKRHAPAEDKPPLRKLMSLGESRGETEKKQAECVRKSFESYLDPLVRKLEEFEMKTRRRRRSKREIELDESMPNDFQNFLVTSLGGFGSQKREVVKKDEAVWDSEDREESSLGKRDTSGNVKAEKNPVSREDATNIRIKIVDGNGREELVAKASESDGVSKEVKAAEAESGGDANVHEVYLITNADSKRKKKKFANDQSPQKQPISSHLPQVETVYNPNPGSNKAQMEKIISSDTQLKGKFSQPPTVYNATASTMEDNIIRNNLRTGNINTFTFQQKEEATPYPLQGPTNPPSSEFEMLNSKSLSRSKPFGGRVLDYGEQYSTNSNPEIIYKDQTPQQYRNGMSNGVRPGYRADPVLRVFKSGADDSGADHYRKDYAEDESAYAEYEYGDSFGSAEKQAEYEDQENGKQGTRREDTEEYSQAQDNLDPKMVELWNDYARTHLSPERHKEAMEREFQEAYFRSAGQVWYVAGNPNQPSLGASFIQNPNVYDFNRADKQKTREKLSKRLTEPIKIGRRFFYTVQSEVPADEYYTLVQDSSKGRSSDEKARVGVSAVNVQETRVKRSGEAKIEKRLSSGHLTTENHYRKYHKKNLNEKPETDEEEELRERAKRDSVTDFLKADMMRRIEEEKKIRSKVKGLSSDLTKYEIPLIESLEEEDFSLPERLLQHLEEEKKDKMTGQNPYSNDQQQQQPDHPQYGNLKGGNPDVFKTFEIKRGRRQQRDPRATPSQRSYEDRVFLKGVGVRNVKKYSDEGFETLGPDARFFDKSSLYSEVKPSDGPFRVPLDEKGDKASKSKEGDGQQKLQKLTHGFSHEAPLLTPHSPLNSPKIFNALKDAPPKEDVSLGKGDGARLKSNKKSQEKEPLLSAVLVLTKREDSQGDVEEKRPEVEKRGAEWHEDGGQGAFRPIGLSSEIVNEEGEDRSCGVEPPTKPLTNKTAQTCTQSNFPFRRMHNCRNGGGTGIGNCGEDILESILGKVESSPHFRRVIGPGLKWRSCKCPTEGEDQSESCTQQPGDQNPFLRQVRKILARFVKDIEKLASQDFTRIDCRKPDSKTNRFLFELLGQPDEAVGSCKHRKFLGSLLRESSGAAARPNNADAPCLNAASVEATENRRELVARLLEEYHNLPDDEKRSVEVLGQYLNHELRALNRALNSDEASQIEKNQDIKERDNSAASREVGDAYRKRAELASHVTQETGKDSKRDSALTPRARSNPEKPESVKDGMDSVQSSNRVTQSPTTEAADLDESPETTSSARSENTQPGKRLGELDKLGYGDAAGLQQSLKSHRAWLSNLNLAKGRPVDAWRVRHSMLVTESPVPDGFVEAPDTDDSYGLDYKDYDYDGYRSPEADDRERRGRVRGSRFFRKQLA